MNMIRQKNGISTFLRAAGRFFVELTRPRTSGEYACLLCPGGNSGAFTGKRSRYPWLFFRVFAVLFGLFAVCALYRMHLFDKVVIHLENSIATMIGAMLFSLPVLLLIYELCPCRDLGFAELIVFAFIGGAAAILCPLGNRWSLSGDVLYPLSVGVSEEAVKALVTILILLLTGHKSPVEGLLIGAAIGCGFGAWENLPYLSSAPAAELVRLAFLRGRMQYATHIAWTAAVGWAFRRFRRPVIHPGFWGVLAGVMAMHALWDMKTFDAMPAFLRFRLGTSSVFYCLKHYGTYVIMTLFWFLVIRAERKKHPFPPDDSPACRFSRGWTGRLSLLLSLTVVSGLCCVYARTHADGWKIDYVFGTVEDFLDTVQGGLDLCPDRQRPFDPDADCHVIRYEDGQVTYAEQDVPGTGNMTWRYSYQLDKGSGELTDSEWPPALIISTEDEYGPYEAMIYPEQLKLTEYDRRYEEDAVEGVDYIFYYPVYEEAVGYKLPDGPMYGSPQVKDGQVVYSATEYARPLDSASDKVLAILAGVCLSGGITACAVLSVSGRKRKE